MKIRDILNWRYATKRMTGESISNEKLELILESIRLAPTAYGLQPFGVTVVENKDIISEIYDKACPQIVLKQCSHLLVFRARKKIDNDLVDGYVEELIKARGATEEEVIKFRSKIQAVQDNPEINKFSWSIRQAYIALGYATFAAASLGVDSTPIEGFKSAPLNEVLGLDIDREEAVVMLTLGFRNEDDDRTVKYEKIRRPLEKMFERL